MDASIDTVIVGGGQAGLSLSYYLQQQWCDHVVLEQAAQTSEAWRKHRWESFTLVTPNWSFRLPGGEYRGNDPHGYLSRLEVVNRFEGYVDQFNLPVRYRTRVTAIEPELNGVRYLVHAEDTIFRAHNVVIATGLFQQGKISAYAAGGLRWDYAIPFRSIS